MAIGIKFPPFTMLSVVYQELTSRFLSNRCCDSSNLLPSCVHPIFLFSSFFNLHLTFGFWNSQLAAKYIDWLIVHWLRDHLQFMTVPPFSSGQTTSFFFYHHRQYYYYQNILWFSLFWLYLFKSLFCCFDKIIMLSPLYLFISGSIFVSREEGATYNAFFIQPMMKMEK